MIGVLYCNPIGKTSGAEIGQQKIGILSGVFFYFQNEPEWIAANDIQPPLAIGYVLGLGGQIRR